jgi:hypothetical protein
MRTPILIAQKNTSKVFLSSELYQFLIKLNQQNSSTHRLGDHFPLG